MTGKDAIRDIMWEKRLTQVALADLVNLKQNTLATVIKKTGHDMRADTLAKLANAMGCEVVIRDPDTGKEWYITCEE